MFRYHSVNLIHKKLFTCSSIFIIKYNFNHDTLYSYFIVIYVETTKQYVCKIL